MAYVIDKNSGLGYPAFDVSSVDVTPRVPVGTRARAFDNTGDLGAAEFVYLQATVAFAAGDAAVFRQRGGSTTAKTVGATHANSGRQVIVAFTAIPLGSYGWFQTSGVAACNVLAGTGVDAKVYLSATAGSLTSTLTASWQIEGAVFESAIATPIAGQAYINLNGPATVQSQLT